MSRRVAAVLLALLSAPAAWAQFMQYTPPGSLANPQVTAREQLEAALKDARWRLGRFSLAPWMALKDFGYVDNVYGTETNKVSDYTATAGVGLNGFYQPTGKVIIAAGAMPEYVWWKDLASRRVWNGRYRAGVFAYFNRLTIEASGSRTREQQYVSSEFEQPVNLQTDLGKGSLEFRLFGRLALTAGVTSAQIRYRAADIPGSVGQQLLELDRNERELRGGLRYYIGEKASLGIGVEASRTEFVGPGANSSNEGTSPVVEFNAPGDRWSAQATVLFADLKPRGLSQFVALHKTLGSARISWNTGRMTTSVYAARNLAYSFGTDVPYYLDDRTGVAFDRTIGWRSTLKVFYEVGRLDYSAVATASDLSQDSKGWGAALGSELSRNVRMTVQVTNIGYTSHSLGDRTITRVQASLQFANQGAGW
jgi:hypothetical protein